jgi:hypothetical protein
VDQVAADFALGTFTDTYLAETQDGEVTLAPAEGAEFSGTSLPAGWGSFEWHAGGVATVSGGQVSMDGRLVRADAYFAPGYSLEFVATFSGAPAPGNRLQHVGFGGGGDTPPETFNTFPWAMFSTGLSGGQLLARVWDGGPQLDTPIPGDFLGAPHHYRIDWNAASVDFYIDGSPVHSEPITISTSMRAAASDYDLDGVTLDLDWMRIAPYVTAGSFESRIFDAGDPATWHTVTWNADLPAETSLSVAVRTGDTAVPDSTWTAFVPVPGSGSDVSAPGRFLQYRTDLCTTNTGLTPSWEDVTITCAVCADTIPPAAVADLAAAQVKTGNPPGERTEITLSWSPAETGATVALYEKAFGNYPEYDDPPDPGAAPATPSSPDDAVAHGWTLIATSTDSSAVHLPSAREFWYFVAFVEDACGNVSESSNRTGGTLNYHLGDVSNGDSVGVGDNVVDGLDFSALGAAYGTAEGDSLYLPVGDVGPTTTMGVDGRPATDNVLNFEDLMVFAINYQSVSQPESPMPLQPASRNALTLALPGAYPGVGGTFDVGFWMQGDGAIHGLSTALSWNPEVVRPLSSRPAELLDTQALSGIAWEPAPGSVDVALLGSGAPGITGEGMLARMTFQVVGEGDVVLGLDRLVARDEANQEVTIEGHVATDVNLFDLPQETRLYANAPNPFGHSTRVAFDIAQGGRVRIKVYSVSGRLVQTLTDQDYPPGRYVLPWQGRDDAGRRVASGVYFVRMEAPGYQKTWKLVALR